MACCHDCQRPYGDEHGFPDLVVPNHIWCKISPTGNSGGLLCPSCLCARLHAQGIKCAGAFLSGPVTSVSSEVLELLCKVDNLQRELERVLAAFSHTFAVQQTLDFHGADPTAQGRLKC